MSMPDEINSKTVKRSENCVTTTNDPLAELIPIINTSTDVCTIQDAAEKIIILKQSLNLSSYEIEAWRFEGKR